MRNRALLLLPLLLLCSACGPSYIILEISADLDVPSEANSLHILTLDPADPSRELANVDFPLAADDGFPLQVLLEPAENTPTTVRQRVTARLDGAAVARAEVEHPWEEHHSSYAAFTLRPVP